jgi:hypothetical protein
MSISSRPDPYMSEPIEDSESIVDPNGITPKTINDTTKETSKPVKSKQIL